MKLTEELRETIEETKQNSAGDNATIIANSFFKSVLGLVPVVGDTAMEIYEELQSRQVKRKIKRLENFYHELDDKINSLQDKVNQDYLSQDDFLDVFERSTRYVVLERHERKRQLFANILTNSVTESVCDYDKTERYFRLLDNLTELELKILAVLDSPETCNKNHGMIIEDPVYNAYQTSCNTVRAEGVLTQLLRIKIHDLDEAITMLHSNGLIVDNFMGRSLQTNGNVVHVLDNMLTVRGKDFVKFLK